MLKRVVDAAKHLRKQQPVYQPWTHGDSTELRNLTALSTKSDLDVDTEYSPHVLSSDTQSLRSLKKTRVQRVIGDQFAGWRFGALQFGVWATIVFLINFIVTIWGSTARSNGVLLEGDCGRVKRLNTGLHVLINILSTILLSGSNYCMQCLSGPTRSEVDQAHAQGIWLDIGIPSIRNVKHLGRQRIVLWMLLAITSLPLHLFYNSAVFGSLSSNDYLAFSVSNTFLEDADCRNCSTFPNRNMTAVYTGGQGYGYSSYSFLVPDIPNILSNLHKDYKSGKLERFEAAQCLDRYATSIQSERRHLLLVAGETNFPAPADNKYIPGSHVYWANPFYSSAADEARKASDAYAWICSGLDINRDVACSNRFNEVRSNASAWHVGPYCKNASGTSYSCGDGGFINLPVEYCLSQRAEPHCRLQFNTTIAIIVTVLNFVKAVLMFLVAFRVKDEPLITMGDAVATYLEKPDSTSKDMCLLSIHDIRHSGYQTGAREWRDLRLRWKDVASKKRRATTLAIFACALIIVICLLAWGVSSLPSGTPRSLADLTKLGYGTVDPRTAITGLPNNLVLNAIVANSPQVILSMLYFSYNALFTSFLLSYEWTTYAQKKAGLRVSRQPIGSQRTEYFLQLPYRFGIPLMALSGTLHWLVSQAIFLVSIDFYDLEGIPGSSNGISTNMMTCGFSPIAIISVIILGVFMMVGIVGFGYIPYRRGMPLAGSCSMAMSAACHVDKRECAGETAAVEKVQWGVVGVTENGVGHCSFSTGVVGVPVVGEMYAGHKDGI
ncbi:hypothetical protein FB567DRAFT_178552 [Paraphoma chrysanthemicola]|uniref:DUF6536 domain-containing protein n=1 Tax=Paraphoma chrysanthemicola TaxID=798071 RepID=A0A8K0RIZ7_9PLEO|nr:hypothetical protein FB567DRAFT_178552 [Paraphoma chrysanthemicola]